MKVLVTGAAGFIGYHLSKHLISQKFQVVGLDNINDYYDINLKKDRLIDLGLDKKNLEKYNVLINKTKFFKFIKLDLEDKFFLQHLFEKEKFDIVCHLAAQAGVRLSLIHI